MARTVEIIPLNAEQRTELEKRVRSPKTSKRDHLRAEIILFRAEGKSCKDVSKQLDVSMVCVSKWSSRFKRDGLSALIDKKGRGRKPSIPSETVEAVIVKATRPPQGKNRWSIRSMAQEMNISRSTVQRIWSRNEIKPHRIDTFKISNDPAFEAKFWDVIGIYLDPPEKALVFCCDEKTQVQALERTQRGLPLGIGHIRTETHDYIRHGTTTLFAALNYLDGTLVSRMEQKHTHAEWLRFLKQIDRETPEDLDLHLIIDNYGTRKHENVKQWLEKHPHFHIHFTPTSSSWLNLVERFFADITSECIRNGSFGSVKELEDHIQDYMSDRNDNPKPYRWVAEGQEILEKINRARAVLNKPICGSGH